MLVIQNNCVIALTIGYDMHTSLIIFEGSSLWPLFATSSVLHFISRTRNKKRWFMDCKGASLLRINHIDNAINMAERNRSTRYCQFFSCIRIATFFCSAIFWLSCFHGIRFGKKIENVYFYSYSAKARCKTMIRLRWGIFVIIIHSI